MQKFDSTTILLGFIAILFGLAGTYVLRQYLRQPPPPAVAVPAPPRPPQKITIPLASQALFRMTREEVKNSIKAHAFMTNPDQILGKLVMNPIKKGKTFNTQDFYPPGTSPGIAKRIPPGSRAITILMEPTGAMIGFAGSGQHVDVLFHYGQTGSVSGVAIGVNNEQTTGGFVPPHHQFNPPRNRDYFGNTIGAGGGIGTAGSALQNATVTLVQDAEIMAIGNDSTPTTVAKGIAENLKIPVTLVVTPHEAELLRVAAGHGELSMTLRSPGDGKQVKLPDPVTLAEIINVNQRTHQMIVHRGRSVSRLNFSGDKTIESKIFGSPTQTAKDDNSTSPNSPNGPNAQQSPLPAINIVSPYPYWAYPQPGIPGAPPSPNQQQPVANPNPSSNGSQTRSFPPQGRTP